VSVVNEKAGHNASIEIGKAAGGGQQVVVGGMECGHVDSGLFWG